MLQGNKDHLKKLYRNLPLMFELVLTNGTEDLHLRFKLRNTNIARKWYDELSKGYELFETDRLDHWGIDQQYYIDQLNAQIDLINSYQPIIDRRVSPSTTQADLNYLHKFFEDLRGEVSQGTDWYNTAPENVQIAVMKFNVLIHQLEFAMRVKQQHPTAVVTFKDRPRYELSEEDLQHFTYKWKQGTVYINYCHVGKTVLDAYNDRDTIAEAIRPQTHYSADFMVKFGPSSNPILHMLRTILVNKWIRSKQFNFKNYNLGMIPVADLVTEVTFETLFKFNRVKLVNCLAK